MATISSAALLDGLLAIVGPDGLELAPTIAVDGVSPSIRAWPASLAEAAACLQVAAQAGAAASPWGGGTQQRIGLPPARIDLVLHTERIDRIVEWEPADLTACLEAGATLTSVQVRLAEQGQQLAIDAPVPEQATIGGLVATNTCGPRRWLYGAWRDQIIGMHMALASGEVIKSGGRVVKNVQGYDLAKLFTGSLGTLGIIGQINVKLVPLPSVRRLFVARGSLETAAAFLDTVAASMLRVSTLDLLDQPSSARCGLTGTGFAALVLVEGAATVVDSQIERLRQMASAMQHRDAIDGDALTPVWRAWVDLDRTDDLTATEALITVRPRPSQVVEAVAAVVQAAALREVDASCWARAGNGIVYARLMSPPETNTEALALVQHDILDRWPSTTLTAGDPAVERIAQPWGREPAGVVLMRGLKQRFDPRGTLQPGRFVSGI